jgi:hypothetical protein
VNIRAPAHPVANFKELVSIETFYPLGFHLALLLKSLNNLLYIGI